MVKRAREVDDDSDDAYNKRLRPLHVDHFSRLSDELILKVLQLLPINELLLCERLSRKYKALAGDSQLWKAHYYNHFVRPRAKRLPGSKEREASGQAETRHLATKVAQWLDDEHLNKRGTLWKRQFKLRHNWTRGNCAVNEIPVAEQASIPPAVVHMHKGSVFMADWKDGLRVCALKDSGKIAHRALSEDHSSPPTSLAVDSPSSSNEESIAMVGFEDGSFSLYTFRKDEFSFRHRYKHPGSANGVIAAVAVSWPYVITLTATQVLTLYRCQQDWKTMMGTKVLDPPRQLHSLQSRTVWPPLSASLRKLPGSILISIAFALPTYLSGWTVGIQEVKVDADGNLLDSRIATSFDGHYRPLALASRPMFPHIVPFTPGASNGNSTSEVKQIHSKPNSLSYTHPYLLVSHPDNTLTLYLVNSTADSLSISAGSRLWGHTSSVSGAHVGGRGKAVSISRRGDEMRIWELEGGFSSSIAKKRLTDSALSVQIKPSGGKEGSREESDAKIKTPSITDLLGVGHFGRSQPDHSDLTLTRGWVGFDDENIVYLKEELQGRQALVVYDFS